MERQAFQGASFSLFYTITLASDYHTGFVELENLYSHKKIDKENFDKDFKEPKIVFNHFHKEVLAQSI